MRTKSATDPAQVGRNGPKYAVERRSNAAGRRRIQLLAVALAAAAAALLPRQAAAGFLTPSASPAPSRAPPASPAPASQFRSPVAAVADAVRAYPAMFQAAREKLMLKDPGSEGSLSTTNGLFSMSVHDLCPMVT
jgi:hypothetical protein